MAPNVESRKLHKAFQGPSNYWLTEIVWDTLRIKARVEWGKGKSDPHTKLVDKLAKESANSPVKSKISHQRVRAKWSPLEAEKGSVPMKGQEEIIRVVTDEYLGAKRGYAGMYEVVDRRSPYFQKVDYIFSDTLISGGHMYRVRFNEDDGYPQVVEQLEEFPMDTYKKADYLVGAPGPWEDPQ